MKIAILGWGSLIREPRGLPIDGEWQKDGPVLWIEFSRISQRGARAGCRCASPRNGGNRWRTNSGAPTSPPAARWTN